MTQLFVIEGERKLGLNVTLAVDGAVSEGPVWPWRFMLHMLIGMGLLAAFLMLLSGLPYLQTGPTYCSSGTSDHPCGAPVECAYAGLWDRRRLRIEDAAGCPSVVLLPWRVEPRRSVVPTPISPPPGKARRPARTPSYGPAGPGIDSPLLR